MTDAVRQRTRTRRRPQAIAVRPGRHGAPERPRLTVSLQQLAGNQAVQSLVRERSGPGTASAPLLARVPPETMLRDALPVARAVSAVTVQRAPGPLSAADERAAVAFNRAQYGVDSVRIIQVIVGTKVDGDFGPISAQAVATFQVAQGLGATGQVDQPTLDAVVARCVTRGDQDYAIHVAADFFNQPTRVDTLSLRFDATLATASASRFEGGGLRVIRLGPTAMTSSANISAAITAQLAVAAPAAAPPGPTPTLLRPAQEKSAIAFNRSKLRDRRSIRAIQDLIGATPDGVWSADSAERVAQFQTAAGVGVDGKIGRITINPIVTQLGTRGDQNGAIRAVIDFYRLDPNGLVNIAFDPADANNATTTDQAIPGESVITVGPSAFAQGFAGLVHTIAHEFEHVRQNRVGIADLPISEFLGERVEILSRGMDEEAIAGFMNDATRALAQWNLMPVAQQRANWAKFVEVRNKVRARLAKATAAEQATHAATLAGYNAVVRP